MSSSAAAEASLKEERAAMSEMMARMEGQYLKRLEERDFPRSGSLQEKDFTRHATRYSKRHETAPENIRTTDADWLRATATLLTLQARIFERTPLRNRLLMLAITLHDAKARLAPTLSWNVFYQGCRSLGFCIGTGELSGAALSDRLRACPERRVSLWHLRRPELLIVRRTCLCRV